VLRDTVAFIGTCGGNLSRPSRAEAGPAPCDARLDVTGNEQGNNEVRSMGDKSPKSVRRQATQKQAKSSTADQQKRQAIAAKQAGPKKARPSS
jgi:hypothetical protein